MEIKINSDYSVTGWMLCVIQHFFNDVIGISDGNHRNQVNNFIKLLFCGLSDDKLNVTLDNFWNEYTDFKHKNGPFYGGKFIWRSKEIRDGNSHFCHQKYYLPCTNAIGFVACRVTPKIPGTGDAEHSWCDVKTIKLGKRYAIRRDVSEKQIIVYAYVCIE